MYAVKNNNELVEEPSANYGFTYADYLNWQFDEMVELIRGQIFKMSPAPSIYHQAISRQLSLKLFNYFESQTCQAFSAPTDVVFPFNLKDKSKAKTVVQPDLFVVCDQSKLDDKACIGAPDWIIEIISPHTAKKDLDYKFSVYEEAGVNEYWTVFPKEKAINIYTFNYEGEYKSIGVFDSGIVSPKQFPNLKCAIEDIFSVI